MGDTKPTVSIQLTNPEALALLVGLVAARDSVPEPSTSGMECGAVIDGLIEQLKTKFERSP